MMNKDRPIPSDEYRVIVQNVPIVSVDLLVHHDGGLVLGKRTNEPAAGEWFVPGGTVLKGETRREAAHRVAEEEIGCEVLIDEELGVYEHHYNASEYPEIESKQYLATAFVVTPTGKDLEPDEQHSRVEVFKPPFTDLHNYVERYIRDLRAEGYKY